ISPNPTARAAWSAATRCSSSNGSPPEPARIRTAWWRPSLRCRFDLLLVGLEPAANLREQGVHPVDVTPSAPRPRRGRRAGLDEPGRLAGLVTRPVRFGLEHRQAPGAHSSFVEGMPGDVIRVVARFTPAARTPHLAG